MVALYSDNGEKWVIPEVFRSEILQDLMMDSSRG